MAKISGGIDSDRVLLIYNLDDARSKTWCDYYIAARGLTPRLLGFPLGTAVDDGVFSLPLQRYMLEKVATYQLFYNIEATITGPFSPMRWTCDQFTNDPPYSLNTLNLAAVFGLAKWLHFHLRPLEGKGGLEKGVPVTRGTLPSDLHPGIGQDGEYFDPISGTTIYGNQFDPSVTEAGIRTGIATSSARYNQLPDGSSVPMGQRPTLGTGSGSTRFPFYNSFDYLTQPWFTLSGRIGLPGEDNDDEALIQRCIDDAIANERTYAEVRAGNYPALFGLSDRGSSDQSPMAADTWACIMQYLDRGFTTANFKKYSRTFVAAFYDGLNDQDGGLTLWGYHVKNMHLDFPDDFDFATFNSGLLVPPEPVWCLLGSALQNDPSYGPSIAPVPGAWAFESTSVLTVAKELIKRGGCSGIGATQEPSVTGIPTTHNVISAILNGCSMAEAVARATSINPSNTNGKAIIGDKLIAFGDPLYAPFGREPSVNQNRGNQSMANLKFSEAPQASAPTLAEAMGAAQSGNSVRMSPAQIVAAALGVMPSNRLHYRVDEGDGSAVIESGADNLRLDWININLNFDDISSTGAGVTTNLLPIGSPAMPVIGTDAAAFVFVATGSLQFRFGDPVSGIQLRFLVNTSRVETYVDGGLVDQITGTAKPLLRSGDYYPIMFYFSEPDSGGVRSVSLYSGGDKIIDAQPIDAAFSFLQFNPYMAYNSDRIALFSLYTFDPLYALPLESELAAIAETIKRDAVNGEKEKYAPWNGRSHIELSATRATSFKDSFSDTDGTALTAHLPNEYLSIWAQGAFSPNPMEISGNALIKAAGGADYFDAWVNRLQLLGDGNRRIYAGLSNTNGGAASSRVQLRLNCAAGSDYTSTIIWFEADGLGNVSVGVVSLDAAGTTYTPLQTDNWIANLVNGVNVVIDVDEDTDTLTIYDAVTTSGNSPVVYNGALPGKGNPGDGVYGETASGGSVENSVYKYFHIVAR